MSPQFSICFSLVIGKSLSSVFASWSSAGTVDPATISAIVPGYFYWELSKNAPFSGNSLLPIFFAFCSAL